jgi:hypothetical protein
MNKYRSEEPAGVMVVAVELRQGISDNAILATVKQFVVWICSLKNCAAVELTNCRFVGL